MPRFLSQHVRTFDGPLAEGGRTGLHRPPLTDTIASSREAHCLTDDHAFDLMNMGVWSNRRHTCGAQCSGSCARSGAYLPARYAYAAAAIGRIESVAIARAGPGYRSAANYGRPSTGTATPGRKTPRHPRSSYRVQRPRPGKVTRLRESRFIGANPRCVSTPANGCSSLSRPLGRSAATSRPREVVP